MTFREYLRHVKRVGFLEVDSALRDQFDRWWADEAKRSRILEAREAFHQTLPPPFELPDLPLPPEPEIIPPDPNQIIFESKILPRFEEDILSLPLSYRTEATLAAINLPGWADTLRAYAAAATNPDRRLKAERFFIELGKALSSRRTLWDAVDELIAQNYETTAKFDRPLKSMTEEEASALLGMTAAAYDKRLQRLNIRRKGGRPRNQDKTRRTLS